MHQEEEDRATQRESRPAHQLDHLVMTVRDIDTTCEFYCKIMGMETVEFGDGRKALASGDQKINLHQIGNEYLPHAENPTPGSADLCFLTDISLDTLIAQMRENKITIVEGPITRTGAKGPIHSIYIKDPDGNLIEIANQLSTLTPDQNYAA